MADGHYLDPELTELLRQVGKQHLTSFQPRPVGGRRSRHGGMSSRPEQPRLIRGKVYADVTADDPSFEIDHVLPLASGVDPRAHTDSTSERIKVASILKEPLWAGEFVTAIYNPAVIAATDTEAAIDWELIVVERFRSIRGTWYSGTTTLLIDHIVTLDSGLDPRSDPTSDTETVSVTNVASDTYGSGDKVYADYNVKDGVWEARPKVGSGSTGLTWGIITVTGSAATVSGTPTTDGEVTIYGGGTITGVRNYYPDEATYGHVACVNGDNVFVTWSCNTF